METWVYVLMCLSVTCNAAERDGVYSSKVYLSERACREDAPLVATNMHLMSKRAKDWGWRCEVNTYTPREIPKP